MVDDHPLFGDGLRQVIAPTPDLAVIGTAGTAAAALALVEHALPGMDGPALVRYLHRLDPQVRLVMVTPFMDEGRVLDAVRAGAAAFPTNDGTGAALLTAIRRVARGEYPINDRLLDSPQTARRPLDQFRDPGTLTVSALFAPLTSRELASLQTVAGGQSPKEIARTLDVSDQTAKNHSTAIRRKQAVNDRTQAVMQALQHGWLTPEEDGAVVRPQALRSGRTARALP